MKVELGEADAAIVYRTDVRAGAGDVRAVEIAAPYNVTVKYAAGLLGEPNPNAQAFLDFLGSEAAAVLIERFGFGPPSDVGASLRRGATE